MRRKQIRPLAHFHREAEGNGGGRPAMSGTSHGAGRVKRLGNVANDVHLGGDSPGRCH